jgi:hypothetical protein
MGAMTAAPGLAATASAVDWGVSWRALHGQRESGDLHIVAPFAGGVLVGAIDGLGHGPEAAAAAHAAGEVLHAHADEPVLKLVQRCHEALRRTRGAVLSLASIDAPSQMMTWTGVGNVRGILFYANRTGQAWRETLNARSGVVGYQLPPLKATALRIAPGDTLAFTTDGIRDDLSIDLPHERSPQAMADEILRRFGKDSDDALVLVARWLGIEP